MSKKSNLNRKKKKKEFIKLKNKENHRFTENNVHPALVERLKGEHQAMNVRFGNSRKKASKIILDFAKPLIEGNLTIDEIELGINFSILAWNIAVLPIEYRQEAIDKTISEMSLTSEELSVINDMIDRKDLFYDDASFWVSDHEIEFYENGGLHLSVAVLKTNG